MAKMQAKSRKQAAYAAKEHVSCLKSFRETLEGGSHKGKNKAEMPP